jgi:hypothetical protein
MVVGVEHNNKARSHRNDSGGALEHPPMTHATTKSSHHRPSLSTFIHSMASEYKEAEIVQALCQFLPPSTREKRYCVDIGATSGNDDGGYPSVTHELLTQSQDHIDLECRQHWFGVLIQPDSKNYQALRFFHEHNNNNHRIRCLQITPSWQEGLNERSLVWILRQFASQLPSDFDFMNVDGARCNNYWILRDLLECGTYQPRLVCVPYDASFPKDVAYVPPRGDRYGVASLLGLVEMATSNQYQMLLTTKRFAFLVPNTLFQKYLRGSIRSEPASGQRNTFRESREQLAAGCRHIGRDTVADRTTKVFGTNR